MNSHQENRIRALEAQVALQLETISQYLYRHPELGLEER